MEPLKVSNRPALSGTSTHGQRDTQGWFTTTVPALKTRHRVERRQESRDVGSVRESYNLKQAKGKKNPQTVAFWVTQQVNRREFTDTHKKNNNPTFDIKFKKDRVKDNTSVARSLTCRGEQMSKTNAPQTSQHVAQLPYVLKKADVSPRATPLHRVRAGRRCPLTLLPATPVTCLWRTLAARWQVGAACRPGLPWCLV